MLVALDKSSDQLVFSNMIVDADLYRKRPLVDPILGTPVAVRKKHFRKDSLVRCHFFSLSTNGVIFPNEYVFDKEYFQDLGDGMCRRNESPEHLEGKIFLQRWIQTDLFPIEKYPGVKVVLEHRIFIEQKKRYRIIDVAALFPSGVMMAFECQLSPITVLELSERTEDYESEGIDCLWFFGDKSANSAVFDYIYSKRGELPNCLEFKKQ